MAARLFNTALESSNRVRGPLDRSTLRIHGNLALLLAKIGSGNEAQQHFMQALDGLEHTLPAGHREISILLGNWGMFLVDSGNSDVLPAALPMLEEAARNYEAETPPYLEGCAKALGYIAAAHERMGQLAEAKQLLERSLSINRKLDPQSSATATSFALLATVLREEGDLPTAKQFATEALKIRIHLFNGDHPSVPESFASLGFIESALGDDAAANENFKYALAFAFDLPRESTDLGMYYALAADAELACGNSAKAAQHLESAIEDAEARHGPSDARVTWLRNKLASL
jgi:tetratricopeptide (TPR) repeat protein